MNVWYHSTTIFKQRRFLQIVGILTLCVALITTLFFNVTHAQAGINQTISFQGRLLDKNGQPVPEGYYNIQFKIYQDGSGAAAGNPDGTLKWTEAYVNNGSNGGVYVKNGYLSVDLGSKTAFGSSIDWNQSTLWLSMNIAGSSATCSTFGTSPCVADGEMTPMKRLTASPYALNAGKLNGKTDTDFVQNSTSQQTGNFNLSGTGVAGTLRGTSSIETPLLDSLTGGTLSIGTTNASAISIGAASADQTIAVGTGAGNTSLTVGSTNGSSALTLNGGSGGVTVDSAGGFTVHTNATDTDTLVVASDGNASINLSNQTGFVINNSQQASVLSVNEDGAINTGAGSSLSVNGSATFTQGVKVGNGVADGQPSLLTLDKASSAPTATGDSVLGSMYYDTTLGKVQCYEAGGWGNCSASPDTFVSLSPEYSNAVTNGTGIGTLTSDVCSDTLNVNDGSSGQPTVCGTNETYNFYNWTSSQATEQTKSIYVTYQLPSTFKKFVEGTTSLMARTDSADARVTYQLYQNTATGLVACGSAITASTGAQTSWQKSGATSTNDPSNCQFAGGESLVVKITVGASQDAHAYLSNLNFAYSSN